MEDELPTRGTKITSIALALISAAALAYASLAYAWAIEPVGGNTGYGLRGRQDCVDGVCSVTPFTALAGRGGDPAPVGLGARTERGPSATLRAFGWVTAIASWSAAVTLLLSAVLVAVGKLVFRPIAPTTIALLSLVGAMIGGCVFVAQAREIGTVGWTFWVFGGAVVLGIVAAQGLARFKPGDPFWDNPPPVTDDPDKW